MSSNGTWSGPFGHAGGFGYQEDNTGLQLLGHRYYDPSTGRFLTRDPIKDGRNWYAYGAGGTSPTSIIDPTGLLVWKIVIVAIVIYDVIDAANNVRDIVNDPGNPAVYVAPVIGAIDPTPGNLGKKLHKRVAPKTLRRAYEKHHGVEWPKEPNGRNYDVAHFVALADGGDNSVGNKQPLPHVEHVRRHMEAGDFVRWGSRAHEKQ